MSRKRTAWQRGRGPVVVDLPIPCVVVIGCAALVEGCNKPGETGTAPNAPGAVRGGPPRSSDPLIPADPDARIGVLKVALVNFVGAGYAGGRGWPARVEDVLPDATEVEGGVRVSPAS